MEKSIKKSNRKFLISFLIFNVILFLFLSKHLDLTKITNSVFNKIDPKYGLIVLIYALSIVLEGVLSSNLKAILIFFKIKDPLPGSIAFTKIAKLDPRINFNILLKKFDGVLPNNPKEQNSAWYKIYKKYEYKNIVYDSHKSFLLTRDLASLTLILFFISIITHFIARTEFNFIIYHLSILLVLLIIFIISSNNYGKRFVANALVEFINDSSIS